MSDDTNLFRNGKTLREAFDKQMILLFCFMTGFVLIDLAWVLKNRVTAYSGVDFF